MLEKNPVSMMGLEGSSLGTTLVRFVWFLFLENCGDLLLTGKKKKSFSIFHTSHFGFVNLNL